MLLTYTFDAALLPIRITANPGTIPLFNNLSTSNNENGFVKLNGKEKEKVDILDRTISDIMQYNYESKGMLENLIKDKDKNKLDDSTLKGIISDI